MPAPGISGCGFTCATFPARVPAARSGSLPAHGAPRTAWQLTAGRMRLVTLARSAAPRCTRANQ